MQETWERIERWLSKHAPSIRANLSSGATAEELSWAEEQLGCGLPETFRLSYSIHNGAHGCALLGYWDFYSLSEIVSAWQIMRDCFDRGFFNEAESDPEGPIRRDWWHPRWIPLTGEPSGNHLCMDLDPAVGGRTGQVIAWFHDDSTRELIAPTYEAWWATFADGLEAELFFVDDEGVLVRRGGPDDRSRS